MTHRITIHNLVAGYKTSKGTKVTSIITDQTLCPGEMVCLLGPNGAGKSTLLKTLSGFSQPLSGTVEIDGENISALSKRHLSQLVSIVLTDNNHIHNLTVKEVVAMGRSPYTGFWGRLSQHDREVTDTCLRWLQIEHLSDKKIDAISDGERQKVMIAKAVAQETPYILLDEPTSFLYYPDKIHIMRLLYRLSHEKGRCVLLSTHALEIALQMADRVWFIEDQQFVSGTPKELCNDKIESLSYEKIVDCIDAIRRSAKHQLSDHQH